MDRSQQAISERFGGQNIGRLNVDGSRIRPQRLVSHEEGGGIFSWLWWGIKGFFEVLAWIVLGSLALAGIAIVAALALAPLAGPIFSIYLFFDIQLPWMISALMSAGLPYSLALFIVLLHALAFAAILFTVICVAIRAATDSSPMRGNQGGVFVRKFLAFYTRRTGSIPLLSGIALVNFALTGFGLVGAGVGIYLSVVIIPSVVTAMVAVTGAPIVLATIAGIFMAVDLIALTGMFFMAPTWLAWRFFALPGLKDIQENPMQILALLGMVSGLAFGGYLASLVYPILFTALAGLGLPQATVVLAALVITFEVIFATSFLFFTGATGFTHLFSFTPESAKQDLGLSRQLPIGSNQPQARPACSTELAADRNEGGPPRYTAPATAQIPNRRGQTAQPADTSESQPFFRGKGYRIADH